MGHSRSGQHGGYLVDSVFCAVYINMVWIGLIMVWIGLMSHLSLA